MPEMLMSPCVHNRPPRGAVSPIHLTPCQLAGPNFRSFGSIFDVQEKFVTAGVSM